MGWLVLTPEKIAELKKEYGNQKLHSSRIRLPKQAGGETATIVWREPTYDDWDAAQAADQRAVEGRDGGQLAPCQVADRVAGGAPCYRLL